MDSFFRRKAIFIPKITKAQRMKLSFDVNIIFILKIYKVPRLSCSASIDSNKALKFPFPKDCAPFR